MRPILFISGSENRFRKKLRDTFEIMLSTCFLGILITISIFVLCPYNIDQCKATIEAFDSLPKNSIDVIVLGSSHPWTAIDTSLMYDEYGINIWNYSALWQTLSTEKLFFETALNTQKPKTVIIDTYRIGSVLEDVDDVYGEIYYSRYLPNSNSKWRYLHNAFGDNIELYFDYCFPLSLFHNNWNSLEENIFVTNEYDKSFFVSNRGFLRLRADEPVNVTIQTRNEDKQESLPEKSLIQMDDIVTECKKRNIQLVFVTIPWNGYNPYHDALNEYAVGHGCDYIDFFELYETVGINTETDFRDEGHLGDVGAVKISRFLAGYINSNSLATSN